MSYDSMTIQQAINAIDHQEFFLPALQRKFVWGKDQIELLFDSLMRNYPIGTFLFWRLHKNKAESYVFYKFLTDYDQRSPYNKRKTGAFTHPEIIGVLDGQQRLSSMYIGLMGTHTEKAPRKRSSNPNAYEKMCLYLNLLSLPYEIAPDDKITAKEDQNFEFRFLTDEAALMGVSRFVATEEGEPKQEPMFWLKAGEVLSWGEEPEFDRVIERLEQRCQDDSQRVAFKEQRRLIRRGLETLHKRICSDELINYFEVAKDDLEDILKIFVRVNSGGTVLSKTDLLFSTIVATWDDGREKIEELLKTINQKGDGFDFGNEFLMRCCLLLTDGPVLFKVNSFKAENVERIQQEWPRIAKAVSQTVDMLVEFGFSGSVLTSQNATIIIAYYLHKGGDLSKKSKEGIRRYLIHALLNGLYGSAQDQLLAALRNAFRQEAKTTTGHVVYEGRYSSFSFDEILRIPLPQQKSLAVTEGDIERFLGYTKGPSAFLVLTLLYPHLRYEEVAFHQDHIHPFSGFAWDSLTDLGLSLEERIVWLARRDTVPNLQLLSGKLNLSKNATPLKNWLAKLDATAQAAFARENYFPDGVDLEFRSFMAFYERRKELLRAALRQVFAVTATGAVSTETEWTIRSEDDALSSKENSAISE